MIALEIRRINGEDNGRQFGSDHPAASTRTGGRCGFFSLQGTAMTREEKLNAVAANLAERIDIAIVPEWAERQGCQVVVEKLSAIVPDWLLDVMLNASDGVTVAEAEMAADICREYLKRRLPSWLADTAAVEHVLDSIESGIVKLMLEGNAATA